MNKEEFSEAISEFVSENWRCGCKEASVYGKSLQPDDYKGSYEKAIEQLREEISDKTISEFIAFIKKNVSLMELLSGQKLENDALFNFLEQQKGLFISKNLTVKP